MSKMLLHTQIEAETIRGMLVSLTHDYIEEKIDELQVPSNDVATEVRLTTVRSPVKPALAAQLKTTLRIQDQSEITKAAAVNRAALVTLLKATEAVEQSAAVSPGDGTLVDYATGAVGYTPLTDAVAPDQTEVAEKNNQMKAIKLAMMAGQIMVEAFRQDICLSDHC